MKYLMENLPEEYRPEHVALAPELEALLEGGLVEVDDCWFLKGCYGESMRYSIDTIISQFQDRTGYECFVNHIHIDDFLDNGADVDPLAKLAHGIKYAFELRDLLKRHGQFKVIVGYNYEDCHVRFHHVRPNEEWLSSNLEGYQTEAVLVLETEND